MSTALFIPDHWSTCAAQLARSVHAQLSETTDPEGNIDQLLRSLTTTPHNPRLTPDQLAEGLHSSLYDLALTYPKQHIPDSIHQIFATTLLGHRPQDDHIYLAQQSLRATPDPIECLANATTIHIATALSGDARSVTASVYGARGIAHLAALKVNPTEHTVAIEHSNRTATAQILYLLQLIFVQLPGA